MKAALLVFGLALVTGQEFQEDYKTTSTSVVLATPRYFQGQTLGFPKNRYSNDFQEVALTRITDRPQNRLESSFASSLFRSSGADGYQNFGNQFRYGRYQGNQRNRFQQNNQDFSQQRYHGNQFVRGSQQNRFAQNSQGFDQASRENRFQLNGQRSIRLNNQDNFQQRNQGNRVNFNNQNQFQLNNGNQNRFFHQNNQFNRPLAFVEENRPFSLIVSEEGNEQNSFSQQGRRLRGRYFDQVNSHFLDRAFDATNFPAGAKFRLDSVDSSFQCSHRPYGFYADQSSGCRVFHVCNPDLYVEGRPQNLQSSFMCGEGYAFDQRRRTCVQEHLALPCQEASNYYFTFNK